MQAIPFAAAKLMATVFVADVELDFWRQIRAGRLYALPLLVDDTVLPSNIGVDRNALGCFTDKLINNSLKVAGPLKRR